MVMNSNISGRVLTLIITTTILFSCSNHKPGKMTEAESHDIEELVKVVADKMAEYSERGQLAPFLSCYDSSSHFLHFSSDGKMRNYESFKKICSEYYDGLQEQKITTTEEKIHAVDTNLVIVGWTGNIIAHFKNGDTMIMNNYSITNIFKKIDNNWKVIHSHESALPPEIIKQN
jgi:hypothetical protein